MMHQVEVRYNFPAWWIDALAKAYPQDYAALLQAANQPAALCIRVNRRQVSLAQFQAKLAAAGIRTEQL
ncbi:hypothetical protein QP445_14635, partial [Micrococcus luteus]|nr:hypothetical protein [Micrococcus luteus]